jgi:hypothetical protein
MAFTVDAKMAVGAPYGVGQRRFRATRPGHLGRDNPILAVSQLSSPFVERPIPLC